LDCDNQANTHSRIHKGFQMAKNKVVYQVSKNGLIIQTFAEEVLATNHVRNAALIDNESEFEIVRLESVFDSKRSLKDKAQLNKYRNSKTGNAIHAGIRESDMFIGREDDDD
jgi:hypothetical protein